jgi:hypothetical protein
MLLGELCELLEVPPPDPTGPDDETNAYVFERAVPFPSPDGTSTGERWGIHSRRLPGSVGGPFCAHLLFGASQVP